MDKTIQRVSRGEVVGRVLKPGHHVINPPVMNEGEQMGIVTEIKQKFITELVIESHDIDRIRGIKKHCGSIDAIWVVRNIYKLGLLEAKHLVDDL